MFNLHLKNRVSIYINPPSTEPSSSKTTSWHQVTGGARPKHHAMRRCGGPPQTTETNEEDWFGKKKSYTCFVIYMYFFVWCRSFQDVFFFRNLWHFHVIVGGWNPRILHHHLFVLLKAAPWNHALLGLSSYTTHVGVKIGSGYLDLLPRPWRYTIPKGVRRVTSSEAIIFQGRAIKLPNCMKMLWQKFQFQHDFDSHLKNDSKAMFKLGKRMTSQPELFHEFRSPIWSKGCPCFIHDTWVASTGQSRHKSCWHDLFPSKIWHKILGKNMTLWVFHCKPFSNLCLWWG